MFPLPALKLLVITGLLGAMPGAAASNGSEEEEDTEARRVMEIRWSEHDHGEVGDKTMLTGERSEILKLEQMRQTGGILRVVTLKNPPLHKPYYAVKGEVRYSNVLGASYLELMSHFPGMEGMLATRAFEKAGPMQRITGNSGWRPFWVPFDASKLGSMPDEVILKLVMASVGVVEIRSLELYEFDDVEAMWEEAKPDEGGGDESLSSTSRRIGMVLVLVLIAGTLTGGHLLHLRLERRLA